MTLPRKAETADSLHYIKAGLKDNAKKLSSDGSGDYAYCQGPVGAAFGRILIEYICDPDKLCACQ